MPRAFNSLAIENAPVFPTRELLLPRNVGVQHVDADVADELLRAAFAPDRRTLAEAYIVQAEDLVLFLRLRVRHQIDARTIATWYGALSTDRRQAALAYLLRGRLQQEVLQYLVRPEDRPDWLEDYDEVWMSLFPAIYQLSRYLEKYRRLLTSAARRPAELYRVTCLLAPRVDEALTGAGQHFDAPPAPLNMGLHWVLRELVRVGVLDGNHIFPDCWVPSDRVLRFLQPLGLEPPDGRCTNSEKAHCHLRVSLSCHVPSMGSLCENAG